jgi:UDP-N-acetylglucosamine acyltransferase
MIHSTAFIDERAKIGSDVFIGPGAVILGETEIGSGSYIHNHATIGSNECKTVLGERNVVFPGAVIGGVPQDLKYDGERTELHIGDGNTFRECVTVNTGTESAGGKTVIGSGNLIMAYCHIAHDCILGDHIVVANSTNFAGHVIVEDHVKVGGVCSFSQFVRLGEHSYIAGESSVNKDILPYTIARGNYAVSSATNKIGLERAGFSSQDISLIHKAIRSILKSEKVQEEVIQDIEASLKENPSAAVQRIVDFVKASERGVAK